MTATTSYPTFGIRFGALSPLLAEQLASMIETDAHREVVHHAQLDADAVCRLQVRGLMAEGAAETARKRIYKQLFDCFFK